MNSVFSNADMKDSGFEWLGNVPSHWKIERLQSQLYEVNETNDPIQTTQILSLTNKLGVVPYKDKGNQGNKAKEDLTGYKIAYPDCIVANSMNILIGSVGLSRYYGCVSPVYYVFHAKEGANIKFLNYVFALPSFQKELRKYANGILEIRLRISSNNILKRKIALPPPEEQAAIVSFLEDKCPKIDQAIAEAKASIDDYTNWKSSVLYEAVTKGVSPVRQLRDSGTQWIGNIPAHWQVSKIGRFIKIRSGITLGKTYPQGTELIEMPYLRVANVKAEGFALEDVAKIKVTPEETEKYALKSGELLMTEGGDRDKLGRGTIWHEEISPCLHQNHVFAVTCDENWLLTEYLAYLTASPVGREYFDLTAKKTTNLASTNSNTIMQFKVPIPPITEQREIVQMLDRKCAAINDLITEKQLLISDLEQYKKSLIYEVVTGKRKVV